jgi:hypothetical protein
VPVRKYNTAIFKYSILGKNKLDLYSRKYIFIVEESVKMATVQRLEVV